MNKPGFYIILLSILFSNAIHGQQNLVPNPGFEEFYECPDAVGSVGDNQLEKAIGWYKPNMATTDYYNSCAPANSGVSVPVNFTGYQLPFDGASYVGLSSFIPNDVPVSEYIQCQLTEPMKPCYIYHFSMRVNLSNFSTHAINSIGVRFDKTPIENEGADAFNGFEMECHICSYDYIVDTIDWVLFEGDFTATGEEEYLTIGRFLETPYSNLNIPNISVYPDSAFSWHDLAYYYIDSINVIESGTGEQDELPNVITANEDGINDLWFPYNVCADNWKCIIVNRWGEKVFSFCEEDSGWTGRNDSNFLLSEGTYHYIIIAEGLKKTGFIQLVR